MTRPGTIDRPPIEESWVPAGFVRLERRGPTAGAQVGCILLLATLLLVVGGGAIWLYFFKPAGKGDPLVLLVVGALFAVVGLVLLVAGVRGWRGASFPATELFLAEGAALVPGSSARLRVRQPGPISIDSLKVLLVCERVYRRKLRPNSAMTVEDKQLILERTVFETTNERVAGGGAFEQEIEFGVPADAPPTGPAQPDGTIRWTLDVRGDAGFMRATFHPFEVTVGSRTAQENQPNPI